jgi:hypothetical protein
MCGFILDLLDMIFSFIMNIFLAVIFLIIFIFNWILYLLTCGGAFGRGPGAPKFGMGHQWKTRYIRGGHGGGGGW